MGLYCFMLLMLLAGTVNILLLKFQHMQMVPTSEGAAPVPFDHPWFQAGLMMVGELMCLFIYLGTRTREDVEVAQKVPKTVFLVPCCCDIVATALFCMGLGFIAASVAQMCRGTIVLFVCAMSVVFLGRRQFPYHLAGVALVTVGIGFVALSALLGDRSGGHSAASTRMLVGILLVIFAQLFQASMFVYEEKIMSQYVVRPLQVVGMEGLYGVGISALILSVLHTSGHADTPGAIYQIMHSHVLLASVLGSIIAVAFFNFAGATVTQRSSAVARTTIKMSSTILIWLVELTLGWNTFSFLQLFGFVLVAMGTLLYNRIFVVQSLEPSADSASLNIKGAGKV